jgi:hypothetical protein
MDIIGSKFTLSILSSVTSRTPISTVSLSSYEFTFNLTIISRMAFRTGKIVAIYTVFTTKGTWHTFFGIIVVIKRRTTVIRFLKVIYYVAMGVVT